MSQSWETQEWKGSKPQRFSGGVRYFEPKDQLGSFLS